MKLIKIGYDLDGVLALWNAVDRELLKSIKPEEPAEQSLYLNLSPNKDCLIKPVGTIITSRPPHLEGITRHWLATHNITYEKLFCCGDTQQYAELCGQIGSEEAELNWGLSQAMGKAKIINQEGLSVFLEDRKDVVDELIKLCPRTLIIWYYKNYR